MSRQVPGAIAARSAPPPPFKQPRKGRQGKGRGPGSSENAAGGASRGKARGRQGAEAVVREGM
eukprot:1147362-Pelagomonas_calceolata.AAC.2